MEDLEKLKETIKKQEELIHVHLVYEKLLGDELDELSGIAFVHGWRSSRYEKGKELRGKIDEINKDISILRGNV